MRAIMAEEAAAAGIGAGDILGLKRTRKVAAARHAAIRRVHAAFPAKSSPELGRIFGLHHTTILTACGRGKRGKKQLSSRTLAKPAAKAARRSLRAGTQDQGLAASTLSRFSPPTPRLRRASFATLGRRSFSEGGWVPDSKARKTVASQRARLTSGMTELDGEPRPWTPAMTAFLVRMRRQGKTFGWIAKALGVTRGVAVGRAMKRSLGVRPALRVRVIQATREGEPAAIGAM